jgi:hypothetical protein
MIFLLIAGGVIKYNHVYRDYQRDELMSEFKSGKLSGIRTNPRNFNQINSLMGAVEENTLKGEYIVIYPDFPILYYLTDRKNPTPVDWYYWRGLHMDMVIKAAHAIGQIRPKVVFVQKFSEADYRRAGAPIDYVNTEEYAPLYEFINHFYKIEGEVGDIFLFVPKN